LAVTFNKSLQLDRVETEQSFPMNLLCKDGNQAVGVIQQNSPPSLSSVAATLRMTRDFATLHFPAVAPTDTDKLDIDCVVVGQSPTY